MRILFIGDSITEGRIGVNWVNLLKLENPSWIIKNAGIGGDTLINVGQRAITELSKDPSYDLIVFEAGYNDIILPHFNNRGPLYRFALRYLLSKGRAPLTGANEFQRKYEEIVGQMKQLTNAKIILTTLSCINESLDFGLNKKRAEFNQIIRETARNLDCELADIADHFDTMLNQTDRTDYLLKNFWNSVYFDPKACRTSKGADKLSIKRKLQLTIDGVHLNSEGALIFKSVIGRQIRKIFTNVKNRLNQKP